MSEGGCGTDKPIIIDIISCTDGDGPNKVEILAQTPLIAVALTHRVGVSKEKPNRSLDKRHQFPSGLDKIIARSKFGSYKSVLLALNEGSAGSPEKKFSISTKDAA